MRNIITEICKCGRKIVHFLGDNPKRAFARDALNHASNYPCEYCEARGVSVSLINDSFNKLNSDLQLKLVEEKLSKVDNDDAQKKELLTLKSTLVKNSKSCKRRKITWPASTAQGEPRTVEKILNISNNIDSLSREERKGITGRSLFLDVPSFDVVKDFPSDNLPSTCLGQIKRLVELTFACGDVRERNTKRKLSKPELFNKLMAIIKTPREFPRRARELDFSVLKGAEFRNLALFYFPIICECIEQGEGERKLWLYLAYMIRACVLPINEYEHFELSDVIKECCTNFYRLYEKIMGLKNCTYNTHVVGAHLIDMRVHGPLTITSTFGFESMPLCQAPFPH